MLQLLAATVSNDHFDVTQIQLEQCRSISQILKANMFFPIFFSPKFAFKFSLNNPPDHHFCVHIYPKRILPTQVIYLGNTLLNISTYAVAVTFYGVSKAIYASWNCQLILGKEISIISDAKFLIYIIQILKIRI